MGWQGADWLERGSREAEEKPDQLLDLFELQPGEVVADVGCGTGYFARRLVQRVAPEGLVYCVDIQPQMLRLMKERTPPEQAKRIIPVLSQAADPKLPDGTIDFVLLVDVYHEIQNPASMLEELRNDLSPRGRIGLVEYRLEGPTARHIRLEHRMSPGHVLAEWIPAGFELEKQIETMPSQHVFIFRAASTEEEN
jgi:ubiquinone/menaquinone biosynthesis C-methylase UbiE